MSRSGSGFATFSTRSKDPRSGYSSIFGGGGRGSLVRVSVLHAEHIDELYPTGTMHTAVFAAYAEAEEAEDMRGKELTKVGLGNLGLDIGQYSSESRKIHDSLPLTVWDTRYTCVYPRRLPLSW